MNARTDNIMLFINTKPLDRQSRGFVFLCVYKLLSSLSED
jgi:hypothetical protein